MHTVVWLEQSERYVNLELVTRAERATFDGEIGIELHFTSGEVVFYAGHDAGRIEYRLRKMQPPRT